MKIKLGRIFIIGLVLLVLGILTIAFNQSSGYVAVFMGGLVILIGIALKIREWIGLSNHNL